MEQLLPISILHLLFSLAVSLRACSILCLDAEYDNDAEYNMDAKHKQ